MNFFLCHVLGKQKSKQMTSKAQPPVKYGSFVTDEVLKRIIIYEWKIPHVSRPEKLKVHVCEQAEKNVKSDLKRKK